MSCVFVVDTEHRPLDPVHPGAARRLLSRGQAAVWRRYPFTLILKREAPDAPPHPLRLKIDPGSRTTSLALVTASPAAPSPAAQAADKVPTGRVLWAGELIHRGQAVHEQLATRRAIRCGRRQRHTRYRPSRFANRRRPKNWLPSRLANTQTWVRRLCRLANVVALSQELVKFDTPAMQHPEISGADYQQGTLAGYELREYRLEQWGRRCAYCHATAVPLQIEHLVPKARAGADRASNLTVACEPCNQRKGTLTAEEYGHLQVQAQAQAQHPLRDVAAVNATRWALFERLRGTGLSVETGTGGRTKWNRTQRHLPKTHWLHAACVGASTPEHLLVARIRPVTITATGRHVRQMCRRDRFGFPRTGPKATSTVGGLRTGDLVRAVVRAPSVKAGTYVGRLAVRASGLCNITTAQHGVVQSIHVRLCRDVAPQRWLRLRLQLRRWGTASHCRRGALRDGTPELEQEAALPPYA
jgi:5-methylcytosine-specific restriction endonuclease McrA